MKESATLTLAFFALSIGGVETAVSAEIAPSAEEVCPILVGSPLPDVRVTSIDGESVTLAEVCGGEPTVLVVYRGGWCPVCTQQLSELRHVEAPLREMGVRLCAIGADIPSRLESSREGLDLPYALYGDYSLVATKALGLAFRVSDEYARKLEGWGLDTEGNAVSDSQALPVPGVFVVDREGRITFSYANPNYQVRCDAGVVLAAAKAVVEAEPAN